MIGELIKRPYLLFELSLQRAVLRIVLSFIRTDIEIMWSEKSDRRVVAALLDNRNNPAIV
jgi:hypothetical protein